MGSPAPQMPGPVQQPSDRPRLVAQRTRHLRQALELTVAGLETSLRLHMPSGIYRDFCLWAISSENPRREGFLRAAGLGQLVDMTVELLEDGIDEPRWQLVLTHTVCMNVYRTYEAVSAGLATGLASLAREDETGKLRRELLCAFNRAMIARLRGEPAPAAQLLAGWQDAAACVSLFDQSIVHDRQLVFARAYLRRRCDVSLERLEYAGWAPLVANVEACVDLVQSVRAHRSGEFVRRGLIGHYEATNRLLKREALTLPQLALIGASSTLAIPTLAYYVTLFDEFIQPLERYSRVAENGSLAAALLDAALNVRLLKDLGTALVTLPERERAGLCDGLATSIGRPRAGERGVLDTLADATEHSDLLARLHRSIFLGEFNVCLYHLADTRSAADALSIFAHNIDYFARLHAHAHARLQTTLAEISEYLGDDQISRLISRFVRFHETLYSRPVDADAGEYPT